MGGKIVFQGIRQAPEVLRKLILANLRENLRVSVVRIPSCRFVMARRGEQNDQGRLDR